MKVGELKKILKDVDDNMEVYVYADHGSMCMKASGAGYQYIEELEWMTESVDEEDLDYYQDAVKVFEIFNQ